MQVGTPLHVSAMLAAALLPAVTTAHLGIASRSAVRECGRPKGKAGCRLHPERHIVFISGPGRLAQPALVHWSCGRQH